MCKNIDALHTLAFSLLANAFSSQQESALQDYLEASVMLQYNNSKRGSNSIIGFFAMNFVVSFVEVTDVLEHRVLS